MEPILLDLPEEYETERLTVRAPRPGDSRILHPAYVEAGDHVYQWVRHANPNQSLDEVEEMARNWRVKFLLREEFNFLLFLRETETFVGEVALHHAEWAIPQFALGCVIMPRFEGQGYATEAVNWITDFGFEQLGAHRLEIWSDTRNERSWRAAERAGYQLEGVLRCTLRDREGKLRDGRVYAKVRTEPSC